MKKILISGGSGLVGTALTKLLLKNGFKVAHLSTRKNYKKQGVTSFYWNPSKNELDPKAFKNVDVLIHLAGSGIADKRWTSDRKIALINSRVQSAKLLTDFMQNNEHQITRFIGASAIGFYGDSHLKLTEESPLGNGFLAEVCEQWEASYSSVPTNVSKTILRLGIVLSPKGGAMPEMMKTLPLFIGVLGTGKQMYSWIHMNDLVRMFLFLIENNALVGIYNGVAPNSLSQKELAQLIADKKGVFTVPTPEFALKIALGEMKEVVLNSQDCSAQKIVEAGFKFKFENAKEAIDDLL